MANTMLIDATHSEETRVVVLKNQKIEEFDFESAHRLQLRGNIYLAKVTRVEPSLQAAFIDYGGNRHGFLAFSEIHPDYYQIPVADRQALLKEEEEAENEMEALSEEAEYSPAQDSEPSSQESDAHEVGAALDGNEVTASKPSEEELIQEIGAEDALEEVPARKRSRKRAYKIQEVIKRRQILLVQVVKEERGTKGAALTTYLSLAGRYCVLMPNTARGGGISRKITNPADRKRLKKAANELSVPQGMGVILRTAGASRTKAEIKRDFEYLLRFWESVRTRTLESTAPTLVYEEGGLIKRAIRDLYNKDIGKVIVAGETGYREAKDFMKMLMPSHAKNVQPYRDKLALFSHHNIEPQLEAMFSPTVTLKSGGYLVINPTEALVSIDVNSGRSTREHNIENTALQTNLEAAEEIARQLRLRDLAGLIVIDFIDMEENHNNRTVERKLKECLKSDRARIQLGRISAFGLLEMSRQRIRAGVLESTTIKCQHCDGTGFVRSASSIGLQLLRALEDHLVNDASQNLLALAREDVVLYLLNHKRAHLVELENRFGVQITVKMSADIPTQNYLLEKAAPAAASALPQTGSISAQEEQQSPQRQNIYKEASSEKFANSKDKQPRRRQRNTSKKRTRQDSSTAQADRTEENLEPAAQEAATQAKISESAEESTQQPRKRRRGKRGGRRVRSGQPLPNGKIPATDGQESPKADEEESLSKEAQLENAGQKKPSRGRKVAKASKKPAKVKTEQEAEAAPPQSTTPLEQKPIPEQSEAPSPPDASIEAEQPKRKGWWQRRLFF